MVPHHHRFGPRSVGEVFWKARPSFGQSWRPPFRAARAEGGVRHFRRHWSRLIRDNTQDSPTRPAAGGAQRTSNGNGRMYNGEEIGVVGELVPKVKSGV